MPFIAIIGLVLYLYDAGQVWHKPLFRDTKFFELRVHSRMQNKALIDLYDFDSIIMGSSFMFGMSYKEAQDKLGGKWVNMSMSGSSMHDKAVVLRYALAKKKINRLIVTLDWIASDYNSNTESFQYLYDDNEINNMKLYLNPKFILCALTWSNSKNCIGSEKSYQQIMHSNDISLEAKAGEMDWLKRNRNEKLDSLIIEYAKKTWSASPHEFDMSLNRKYIDENILSLVRHSRETQFYFFIPTYTRLVYRIREEAFDFYKWRVVMSYFIRESMKYPNVKVYGFDDLSYADNLGNYIDKTHYKTDLNSMQLDAIKNNTHLLTEKNIESYFDTMEQKIKDYDIQKLAKIIQDDKK